MGQICCGSEQKGGSSMSFEQVALAGSGSQWPGLAALKQLNSICRSFIVCFKSWSDYDFWWQAEGCIVCIIQAGGTGRLKLTVTRLSWTVQCNQTTFKNQEEASCRGHPSAAQMVIVSSYGVTASCGGEQTGAKSMSSKQAAIPMQGSQAPGLAGLYNAIKQL